MSESELEAMNLRQLRQLASEHHVSNRSRLAKQELITALAQVMTARAQSAGQSQAKAESKPAKKSAAKKKTTAKKVDTEAKEAAKAEPEVLDASTLAAIASAPAESKAAPADTAKPAAGEESEERSGNRRRRSRGGRGRSRSRDRDGQAARSEQKEAATADAPKQEAQADTAKTADERPAPAQQERQRRDDRNPQRVPKPRLDKSKLRQVEPVLNRLKTLAGGVLELCDPDTPSWAQARLSELLAIAGVHPTPCQGEPHPDFHDVLSTVKSDQVPEGHIAVIEAPGFSLRGDRGDLFALRKAKVRVAGTSTAEAKPQQEQAAPTAPAKAVEENPASAATQSSEPAKEQSVKKPRTSGPVLDEPKPGPAPHAHRAPKNLQAAALPLEPQAAEELDERGLAEAFGKLGLHKQIQADLHDMGFAQPSPIQEQCIPLALAGNDIIGQAQTGTGKTAAFTLPILHQLYNWSEQGPVALIMCPTRELAKQVHREFVRMAGQSAARAALIYGGVSMDDQFDALASHPHVIIGTPGRLIDHIKRKTLDLSRLQVLVLDEADQMLDIGFLPDIEYVFKHSRPQRQCLLFSATMSDEILRITNEYQNDPAHVHVKPEVATADHVDQKFIAVDRNKKNDLLAHFIDTHNPEQLVVFCKTKAQTDRVAQVLRKKKKKAAAIHGDLPQNKRERTLQQFRDGQVHCLIATNVAARGLDIPAISHVVNYDIPENPDEYVHRIGRTGRMGASGVARTFITKDDGQFLVEIEKLIGFELEEEEIEGFTASTVKEVKRTIADTPTNTPRLLKPLVGGIRLGRRRR